MKKLILLSVLTLLPWMANAQVKRTIHVATAGTLSNYISDDEKYQIEELTLTGELNGTDFRLIRDMAGIDFYVRGDRTLEVITNGILKSLDLYGVKIVEGGGHYYFRDEQLAGSIFINAYTENDRITPYLFYDTKLESIILPENVVSIDEHAFEDCKNLFSIIIPSSFTSIDPLAFNNCSALNTIDKEDYLGVKNDHGVLVFYSWANDAKTELSVTSSPLKSYSGIVFIPESIKLNGKNYSVTRIGNGAFKGCTDLTYVTIPNSVTEIGNSAFEDCSGLTHITIPNSVIHIGEYSFSGCQLNYITLGNSVATIRDDVFPVNYIKDVYCYAEIVPDAWSQFCGTVSKEPNVILHVPASSVNSYKADKSWSRYFKTIVPLKDEDPSPIGSGVGSMKGDLNNDGKVNVADLVKLSDIILNQE